MHQITTLWNHTEPESTEEDLQLLTIGGISVMGRWVGEFGEYFVGWSYIKAQTLQPYNHNPQHRNQDVETVAQHVN